MKKASRIFAILLVISIIATLFVGCGADKGTSTEGGEKAIKIGISLPTQREERWVLDKENFEKVAKEMGAEVIIQIADNDAAKQQSQVENMIAQGIDVLILAPHDGAAAANIVNIAHEADIKVISYDRLIMNADVDLYYTFDSVVVGEMQAKWALEQAPKGNYVLLAGDPGDFAAVLYREGALNILQPKADSGDIKIVTDQECKDWQPSEALKHVENALTVNKNDIQAVVAPNDGTAGAAIQALAAQGLAGKVPVTGQDAEVDAVKRIIEGTQGITIFNDVRDLGRAAIEAAIKLAKGETPETNKTYDNGKIDVPSVEVAPVLVDINNYQEKLVDSGYIKAEDLK